MALGPFISSKSELKTFIKEKLGFPVINIEVTDRQIDIAINDTLERFVERAAGGIQFRFLNLATTAGVQSYALDFDVEAVSWLFDVNDVNLGAVFPPGQFSTASFSGLGTIGPHNIGLHRNDLLSIQLTRQHLQDVNFLLAKHVEFDYNSTTRTLFLIDSMDVDMTLGMAYYQRVDYSDENSTLYDHAWIKRYSAALTKKQWASNLLKYTGTSLPAGLQTNADSILSEAKEEIEKLDDELQLVWSLPIDFFVG